MSGSSVPGRRARAKLRWKHAWSARRVARRKEDKIKRGVGPVTAEPCTASAQQEMSMSSKPSYLKGRGVGSEVRHELRRRGREVSRWITWGCAVQNGSHLTKIIKVKHSIPHIRHKVFDSHMRLVATICSKTFPPWKVLLECVGLGPSRLL